MIFAANHHSHVDTPLLRHVDPRAVAPQAVRRGGGRLLLPHPRHQRPVRPGPRRHPHRAHARSTGARPTWPPTCIDDGWSMLIFPEGGRSPDGWGQPFRGGAAYLALRCGVPVVPVHIEGTGRILRKGRKLPTPGHHPGHLRRPAAPGRGRGHAAASAPASSRRSAALADEATTDWWQARRRAHAGETPALAGPDAAAWRRAWALGDPDRKRTPPAPPLARPLARTLLRSRGRSAAEHQTRPALSSIATVAISSTGASTRMLQSSTSAARAAHGASAVPLLDHEPVAAGRGVAPALDHLVPSRDVERHHAGLAPPWRWPPRPSRPSGAHLGHRHLVVAASPRATPPPARPTASTAAATSAADDPPPAGGPGRDGRDPEVRAGAPEVAGSPTPAARSAARRARTRSPNPGGGSTSGAASSTSSAVTASDATSARHPSHRSRWASAAARSSPVGRPSARSGAISRTVSQDGCSLTGAPPSRRGASAGPTGPVS